MTAVAWRGEDPVAALADMLDQIDVTNRSNTTRLQRNESNRIGLLVVHGCAAVLIAPLFTTVTSTMNSPTWVVLRAIPGAPYSLAAFMGLGGLILLPATLVRAKWWEIVGLSLIFAWYATMATGFAGAVIYWAAEGLPDDARPSMYPSLVYGHLAVVMAVHIATLRRLMRRQ